MALIWIGASYVVQHVFFNLNFRSPFFVTYCCNSLFLLYLPVSAAQSLYRAPAAASTETRYAAVSQGPGAAPTAPVPLTVRQTIQLSLLICPFWFAAQLCFNLSLGNTSVVSNTVLSSMSGVFTLILCAATGLEKLTGLRVLGVAAALGGTALYTMFDASNDMHGHGGGGGNGSGHGIVNASGNGSESGGGEKNGPAESLTGDVLAVLSSFLYAVYTTLLRHRIPSDDAVSMPRFFGYLGLFNALFMAPVVGILHATSIEPLGGLTGQIFGWIILKATFDNFLSDYLWARAILLTSATVATVGLALQTPLSLIVQRIVDDKLPTTWSGVGAVLILLGFFLVLTPEAPRHLCTRGVPLRCGWCGGRNLSSSGRTESGACGGDGGGKGSGNGGTGERSRGYRGGEVGAGRGELADVVAYT